jgi:prophage regulatory protein
MNENKPSRLIGKNEVLHRVGISYPTIWAWMKEGKFPRSREIGDRKVAWLESDIEDWIVNLPVKPLKGDTTPAADEAE